MRTGAAVHCARLNCWRRQRCCCLGEGEGLLRCRPLHCQAVVLLLLDQ